MIISAMTGITIFSTGSLSDCLLTIVVCSVGGSGGDGEEVGERERDGETSSLLIGGCEGMMLGLSTVESVGEKQRKYDESLSRDVGSL